MRCDGICEKKASWALAADACISHTLTNVFRLASNFISFDLRSKQDLLDRPRWLTLIAAVGGNSKCVFGRRALWVIGLLVEGP